MKTQEELDDMSFADLIQGMVKACDKHLCSCPEYRDEPMEHDDNCFVYKTFIKEYEEMYGNAV